MNEGVIASAKKAEGANEGYELEDRRLQQQARAVKGSGVVKIEAEY